VPRNNSVVYLDSSAIVKLVTLETETDALRSFLIPYGERVSSVLAEVEVTRASRLYGPEADRQAQAVLRTLSTIAITRAVTAIAGRLPPSGLRSLDAIHVATALLLGASLAVLVTYDSRMASAAELSGISVASPA
jgi:predicted nucleic acid-binding protein